MTEVGLFYINVKSYSLTFRTKIEFGENNGSNHYFWHTLILTKSRQIFTRKGLMVFYTEFYTNVLYVISTASSNIFYLCRIHIFLRWLSFLCTLLQKYWQLNRGNHGNGNVMCELDLYSILRISGAPSIVLWLSCDLEGTFKTGKTDVYFWEFCSL